MNAVTSREMLHNFSAIADRVAGGEELVVTRYGKPLLKLVQVTDTGTSVADRQVRANTLLERLDAIARTIKQPLLKPGQKFDRNEAYERF